MRSKIEMPEISPEIKISVIEEEMEQITGEIYRAQLSHVVNESLSKPNERRAEQINKRLEELVHSYNVLREQKEAIGKKTSVG